MATAHARFVAEMKQQKKIADADRAERAAASKRAAKATTDAAIVKAIGAVGSGLAGNIPGMAKTAWEMGKDSIAKGAAEQVMRTSPVNHPAWYTKLVPLDYYTRVMAYYNAGWVFDPLTITTDNSNAKLVVPQLLTIYYSKTFGEDSSDISQSALNFALNSQLTSIRAVTSVSKDIETSVFGLYLIAVSEVLDLVAEVEMDLRLANTVLPNAKDLTNVALTSRGFAPIEIKNIKANFANSLRDFNIIRARVNTELPYPGDFDLVSRRVMMRSLFLLDSHEGVNKPQIYQAYCGRRGVFDSANSQISYPQMGSTISSRLKAISDMLQAIVEDSTMQEIIRALRSANVAYSELPYLSEDIHVAPYYDELMLEQIHNLTTFPIWFSGMYAEMPHLDDETKLGYGDPAPFTFRTSSLNVRTSDSGFLYQGEDEQNRGVAVQTSNIAESTAALKSTPYAAHIPVAGSASVGKAFDEQLYLNFFKDNITALDVLEASRLVSTFTGQAKSVGDGWGLRLHVKSCMSEVVTKIAVSLVGTANLGSLQETLPDSSLITTHVCYCTYCYHDATDAAYPGYVLPENINIIPLSCFDWAPRICPFTAIDSDQSEMNALELRNYAPLDKENLSDLHRVCTVSLFKFNTGKFQYK